MELQIQDLVSTIKKEGIEAAQTQADAILAKAKEEAAAIVAAARAEADQTQAKAKEEIELLRQSARQNAEHAQRDAVLSFKKEVQGEFEKLLRADIGKAVQGETLAKLIRAALTGEEPGQYAAEVSEVTEALKSELAQEMKNGLQLRVSPAVRSGFRLASKDGSGYFDCSDEEIAGMLAPFFSELSI